MSTAPCNKESQDIDKQGIPMLDAQPTIANNLQGRLLALQQAERLPAAAAAVAHKGTMLFVGGAGEPVPGPDTQFRIGSISKTFTAALVMQLRD